VAFGEALRDGTAWAGRLAEATRAPGRSLLSVATDGETFGHHQQWGDMALAAAVTRLAEGREVRLENYASFLAHSPPTEEVVLIEPSAWSCAHGVERWRSDCGCKAAPDRPTQQAWREVLRDGLDALAARLHEVFASELAGRAGDPWALRDAFGEVLDAGEDARRRFVLDHVEGTPSAQTIDRVLELLDMERDALAMFTSCAWFFDDLAGLEPVQALRTAAHAIDLAGPLGEAAETELRATLARGRSNDPDEGDGAQVWNARVRGEAERAGATTGPAGAEASGARDASASRDVSEPHDASDSRDVRALRAALLRVARAPGDDAAAEVVRLAGIVDRGIVVGEMQTRFARLIAPWRHAPPAAIRRAADALGLGERFFEPRTYGGEGPVGMVFGLHLHQPVGNFDEVFESHTREVYAPLLDRLAERDFLPLTVHVSGPLLEWLEARAHPLLDRIGGLAGEGRLELLLSGFWEPVLPALSRADRREQLERMRAWLNSRFGVEPTGLWLTERVWEPDLVEDLAAAGVRYAFVDDRHVLAAGLGGKALHRPLRTESGGARTTLLPIDERMRYLIPFRSPEEVAAHLRALRADGRPFAILADDAEKFGGWPGTAQRVWGEGWLDAFLDQMEGLRAAGEMRLVTGAEVAASATGSGLAYLPTASYREMEGWSLPTVAGRRLEELRTRAEADPALEGADTFLRGGHWRNFLARYAESNRMHKKAQALSRLSRERGDPEDARAAIGRAQCNDAYWHGVFGGLYLRHLRDAIWANLAEAERLLRAGESLGVEPFDLHGHDVPDVWMHSDRMSCVVSPAQGGAVVELTRFATGRNLANTLTRRWEAYHRRSRVGGHAADPPGGDDAAPSIHDLEGSLGFDTLPPVDLDDRAVGVDRVLPAGLAEEAYARAEYEPVQSWARTRAEVGWAIEREAVVIDARLPGPGGLEKQIRVGADGSLFIRYRWDPAAFPGDAVFAPEFSLAEEVPLELEPTPLAMWRYPIETVSKSERGAETTVQGTSVTPLWPCALGEARVRISGG
jgi:alpha-amylase